MEHVKELLSGYLDKALPVEETRKVETHLPSCEACSRELAELKDVAKLVSSLPRKELPTGFLERLKTRRAAPLPAPSWRPSPLRMAAFAAAGLFVTLTIYEEAKTRLSRPPAENDLAVSDEAGPAARRELAPGSPPPAERYTNENLQGFLMDERKRMGIRQIVPQSAGSGGALGGEQAEDKPLKGGAAREAMEKMTDQLVQMNQSKQSKLPPAVPLDYGSSPRLLAKQESSQPLTEQASDLKKTDQAAQAGSVAMLAKSPGESADVSVPAVPFAPETGPVASSKAASGKRRPAKKFKWAASWSGWTGGVSGPGGAAITNLEYWADLWRKLGLKKKRPRVNFGKSMVLAVFGAKADPEGSSVKISSVREEDGRLLVRYRVVPGEAQDGALASYHVIIVKKSELPVAFERVP